METLMHAFGVTDYINSTNHYYLTLNHISLAEGSLIMPVSMMVM